MKKVVKFLLKIWPLIGDVSEIEATIVNTQTLDKAISYCFKGDDYGFGYCSGVRNTIRAMLPYTKSWPQSWQCLPRKLELEADLAAIARELTRIQAGLVIVNRDFGGDIKAAKMALIANVDNLLEKHGPNHPDVNSQVEKANLVFTVSNEFTGQENVSEIIMLAYHQIHKCK